MGLDIKTRDLFDWNELPSLEADFTRDHKPLKIENPCLIMSTKPQVVRWSKMNNPNFSDSRGNTGRPLKANGAVGLLVKGMLEGKFFSVQSAIDFLRQHGKVSNSPDKRMREARHYLETRGYKIKEVDYGHYKAWGIEKRTLSQVSGD